MTPTPNVTYVPTRPGSRAKARTVVRIGPSAYLPDVGDVVFWVSEDRPSGFDDPECDYGNYNMLHDWCQWIRKHAAVLSRVAEPGEVEAKDAEIATLKAALLRREEFDKEAEERRRSIVRGARTTDHRLKL